MLNFVIAAQCNMRNIRITTSFYSRPLFGATPAASKKASPADSTTNSSAVKQLLIGDGSSFDKCIVCFIEVLEMAAPPQPTDPICGIQSEIIIVLETGSAKVLLLWLGLSPSCAIISRRCFGSILSFMDLAH